MAVEVHDVMAVMEGVALVVNCVLVVIYCCVRRGIHSMPAMLQMSNPLATKRLIQDGLQAAAPLAAAPVAAVVVVVALVEAGGRGRGDRGTQTGTRR